MPEETIKVWIEGERLIEGEPDDEAAVEPRALATFDDDDDAARFMVYVQRLVGARVERGDDPDDYNAESPETPDDYDAGTSAMLIAAGIAQLRSARNLFVRAGAPRAAERVRLALTSADGARRHAARRTTTDAAR